MNPARFSLRHARAVGFVALALSCAGAVAYVRTPAAIFPEMRFSRIDVVADAGDLPPEQVRVAVTAPLQRAFLGLPSIARVTATSSAGSSELVLQFDPASDATTDLQYVDAAIAQARANLPAEAAVQANVVTPQTEPVLSYALTSNDLSPTLVREYAARAILPTLYGIPGLGRVLVVGGGQREYHVDLDAAALAASHATAQDVSGALAAANRVTGVGLEQGAAQRRALLVDAGLRDAAQLAPWSCLWGRGAASPSARSDGCAWASRRRRKRWPTMRKRRWRSTSTRSPAPTPWGSRERSASASPRSSRRCRATSSRIATGMPAISSSPHRRACATPSSSGRCSHSA
jgi:multidrug efflux pump subunit AcrB